MKETPNNYNQMDTAIAKCSWLKQIVVVVVVGALVVSCYPERGTGIYENQQVALDVADANGIEVSDQLTEDSAVNRANTLTGYWVKLDESATCVLVLNAAIESFSWNVDLFTMREIWRSADSTKAFVEVSSHTCRKTMTPIVLSLDARVPTVVLDTMEHPVFKCEITAPEGKTIPAEGSFDITGYSFQCDPWAEVWGVKMEKPFEEALPQTATDPRVFDQDQDGHPGVTLILGDNMCDLYIVQRSRQFFEGKFDSNEKLISPYHSKVEQKVLEGTEGLCAAENEAFSNPARSTAYLMRVDGFDGSYSADNNGDGEINCEDIRATIDDLIQHHNINLKTSDNKQCAEFK